MQCTDNRVFIEYNNYIRQYTLFNKTTNVVTPVFFVLIQIKPIRCIFKNVILKNLIIHMVISFCKLEMCPSEHEWPASQKSVKPAKSNKNQSIQTISSQNIIILVYNSIIIVLVCMSWDSNPRPYDYASDALSLSYRPI